MENIFDNLKKIDEAIESLKKSKKSEIEHIIKKNAKYKEGDIYPHELNINGIKYPSGTITEVNVVGGYYYRKYSDPVFHEYKIQYTILPTESDSEYLFYDENIKK